MCWITFLLYNLTIYVLNILFYVPIETIVPFVNQNTTIGDVCNYYKFNFNYGFSAKILVVKNVTYNRNNWKIVILK